ncbi:MAG TPA: DNA polymerase IV [Nitrospiraceae bacterium]|nr:DNA polymerase IV [Nitrospiraceae bacterium]
MARWPRQILFGDIDAMYASAAIVADPSLTGKPVAVGGPAPRGIILAASYAVRRFGVRSAMPTVQAKRLCPQLILVPPDRALYAKLHREMQAITDRLFPITEWTSIDEFYADTTGLQAGRPDPEQLARHAKEEIRRATGLTCTVGVATGKTVAKIAADAHKPDGLAVIAPGEEASFLAPLPVRSLPGIGPKSAAALSRIGIRLIGDLIDPRFDGPLRHLFGSRLPAVQALAQGIDHDPVVPDREAKSISHETTFEQDTGDRIVLEGILREFLNELAHDLRGQGLASAAFTIKLKDSQFHIHTRQRRFPTPSNYDPAMWPHISAALNSVFVPSLRYRLIGLGLTNLVPATEGLFDQRRDKAVAALDQLIDKHGMNVVRLGGLPDKSGAS